MIYVLVGKEEFLKREFLEELRKKIFPAGSDPSMNYQEFQADQGAFPAFVEFLQTAPFLSEKRLAVLNQIDELEDEEKTRLRTFASRLPSTAEAVLVSGAASLKKEPWLSEISKDTKIITCQPPYDNEWPSWIQTRAKRLGLTLDRDTVLSLLERAGKDIASQNAALEQVALYIHPRKQVEVKDVEALLGKSAEADVFELLDFVLDKKAAACLKKMADLRREGVRAFEVVGVLASQLEKLKKAVLMQRQGDSSQRIGQELKIHSFFLEKFMRQVSRLNEKTMRGFFEQLAECDNDIKTGALREDLAFERLVIRLCA